MYAIPIHTDTLIFTLHLDTAYLPTHPKPHPLDNIDIPINVPNNKYYITKACA